MYQICFCLISDSVKFYAQKTTEVRTGQSITPQENKKRGIIAQVSYFIARYLSTEYFDEIRSRDAKNIVFQDCCGFMAVA
jgi:hypothetical protein